MPHGTDLPTGAWSALLVGHQWPGAASVTALSAAADQRSEGGRGLHSYADLIGSINAGSLIHQDGATAESLRALFSRGEDHARALAEKQGAKHRSYGSAIRSVEALRHDLAEIASNGNAAIRTIQESDAPVAAKVTAIVDIVAQANTDANLKAASCIGDIHAATQSVLDHDGTGTSARAFAMAHGFDADSHRRSPSVDAIRQRVHQRLDPDARAEARTPFPASAVPLVTSGPIPDAAPADAPAKLPAPLEHSDSSNPAIPAPAGKPVTRAVTPPPVAAAAARGPMPGYGADLRTSAPAPASPSVTPSATAVSAPVSQANLSTALGPVVRRTIATAPSPIAPAELTERASPATRLRRLVEAVARQQPRLAWAVGDRVDGSTVLATDLAGGWIPPDIQIPAGVILFAPGQSDCLDDCVAVANYSPGQQISPDFGDPIPISTHARDCPPVEDLGWELVQATRWRDGLPRLAHTLARATAGATGFPDAELTLLSEHLHNTAGRVLAGYPGAVDVADLGNWQLLSALAAFATGENSLADYHFAWFRARS